MAKKLNGGITAPNGFVAAGIHSGIKQTGQLDLALVVSEKSGPIAGVFTKNTIPAPSIVLNRRHLRKRLGQAFIINSGNANAFTGAEGTEHAIETGRLVATQLDIPAQHVFVSSTGAIGVPLPMASIRKGIPILDSQLKKTGHHNAALAIMTTDTRTKTIALQQKIAGKLVTIGGMAKGSGMIHPNMATMLAYMTTDAVIEGKSLQKMLHEAVDHTFNCISVDGDSSTNDTVLCLANGMAGNRKIGLTGSAHLQFKNLLTEVCHKLAMDVCRDGEGVTKVVKIQVNEATSHKAAKHIVQTLATSLLIKTAIFGADPNWGRIIAALGRTGYVFRPDRIVIAFDGITIVKGGKGLGPSIERKIQKIMQGSSFTISVSLGMGKGTATQWTTDLTYDYVKINASYRS